MDDLTNLSTTSSVSTYWWRTMLANVGATAQTLVQLFKLRVVLLLLIAAAGGAVIGAAGWPGGKELLILMITGGLSASGASALNQYLERERDSQMTRTRQRPFPSGQITNPAAVLITSMVMIATGVFGAAIFNPELAFFNALGAAIYVGIYTLWLKPRSVVNIVIGGAAGSCAVLSGGAAAGAWNEPSTLALAGLLFLWTPVHFWSLAMAYQKDYANASFPMLPVHISGKQAAGWVAVHTFGTGIIAIILASHPNMGWLYLIPSVLSTLRLGMLTYRLYRDPSPQIAYSLFKFSNMYLGILLLLAIIDLIWL
ncbi:MAG: protoheme IX farnesyltransferase [Anaerolineae bacterium]|nr:protoheme IX farnesyltransferase [Anaerolineae bacterium]